MDIGIPRERRESEYRVGLTPIGVQLLTAEGHAIYVERDAGLGAGFSNRDYEQAGARIVYQPQEAFGRADLVLKVARPTAEECEWLREGQTLMGLLHLAAARRSRVESLLEKGVTAIGYEMIQDDDGSLPVLITTLASGRPHAGAGGGHVVAERQRRQRHSAQRCAGRAAGRGGHHRCGHAGHLRGARVSGNRRVGLSARSGSAALAEQSIRC